MQPLGLIDSLERLDNLDVNNRKKRLITNLKRHFCPKRNYTITKVAYHVMETERRKKLTKKALHFIEVIKHN